MVPVFLVINAGSSSLKFQVFEASSQGEPKRIYHGRFEGLGGSARFSLTEQSGSIADEAAWPETEKFGHEQALAYLAQWLRNHRGDYRLAAVGHRVVHGGTEFSTPVTVDAEVLQKLEAFISLAPLHQPHNLEPIRIIRRQAPDLPQIACFDTAFHRHQPDVAQLFALPREMTEKGVRRYGFHGLSYAYIASVLSAYGHGLDRGRVVVAHLGNGASLCALKNGRSIATTMGFSALDGLVMGTRCGALDASVVFYMLRDMKLSSEEAERILYTKSGLLGVSGISNDMRRLRALAHSEPDARLAIDLFVYRVGRELGSLIAALGGIDALVFTAGIGENDPATRAEVLRGAAWAGFELDEKANTDGGPVITRGSQPSAWVIATDEELMIARGMQEALHDAGAIQKLAS